MTTKEGTKVSIGGQEYEVPADAFTFKVFKKVWPWIEKVMAQGANTPPMEAMEGAVRIVAAALEKTNPDLTYEKIEDSISATEIGELAEKVPLMMEKAGLTSGETKPPAAGAKPSTETGTP